MAVEPGVAPGCSGALEPCSGDVGAVVTGTGAKVIVEGTLVTIPGFWGICLAQIPARYFMAPASSSPCCDHDDTQSWTFLVKSASLQKQSVSVTLLHLVMLIQAWRQLGKRPGAGATVGGVCGCSGDFGVEGCSGGLD